MAHHKKSAILCDEDGFGHGVDTAKTMFFSHPGWSPVT